MEKHGPSRIEGRLANTEVFREEIGLPRLPLGLPPRLKEVVHELEEIADVLKGYVLSNTIAAPEKMIEAPRPSKEALKEEQGVEGKEETPRETEEVLREHAQAPKEKLESLKEALSAKLISLEEQLQPLQREEPRYALRPRSPSPTRDIGDHPLPVQIQKVSLRQPLLSPEHIRLLRLYPPGWRNDSLKRIDLAKNEDPVVRCDVYQVLLEDLRNEDPPSFSALSYVWGAQPLRPTGNPTIYCDRQLVRVQPNLYEALKWVRHASAPRLLWCDYLCIDQEDPIEKSAQVLRMHRIFEQAHVILWLSDGREFAYSLDALMGIMGRFRQAYSPNFHELSPEALNVHLEQSWKRSAPSNVLDALSDLPWAELFKLLTLPFFSRAWIVQEILSGKSHEARIRHWSFDLDEYVEACQVIDEIVQLPRSWALESIRQHGKAHALGIQYRCISHCRNLVEMDGKRINLGAHRFGYPLKTEPQLLIGNPSLHACSDPRDYIYAFLSHLNVFMPRPFNADYRLPVGRVFIEFAVYCVDVTRSLAILSDVRRRTMYSDPDNIRTSDVHNNGEDSVPKWTTGLPSWCPDWAVPSNLKARKLVEPQRLDGKFNASSGSLAHVVCISSTAIRIKGRVVSAVSRCSDHELKEAPMEDLFAMLKATETVAMTRVTQPSISTTTAHRQFLSVLSTGLTMERLLRDKDASSWRMDRLRALEDSQLLYEFISRHISSSDWTLPQHLVQEDHQECMLLILDQLLQRSSNSKMFTTENDLLNTKPEGMKEGDLVCVLYGGKVPYLIRQKGMSDDGVRQYILIGEAYVDGLMHGEAMDMGIADEDILLV